ncbi:MAG: hypothetical protein JTT11_04645 [Candidatus Brockarchaeota archaeon]|nr:hypothetical protein [Candidatus Brockarchaeota archaeon]
MDLKPVLEVELGTRIGQLRATPVRLGRNGPPAFLVAYAADFDVDPYIEMFFFPKDTLKMALVSSAEGVVWKLDLGEGVVPGQWFCPFLAFDLDRDGVDEIWFVNNVDRKHPLGLSSYRLARIDAKAGEITGQWKWPDNLGEESLSHAFRHFILGGYAKGEPVLVTAQGTYGDMFFQAYGPGMSLRWERKVGKEEPGARGSHMAPIVDLDGDGVQEILWGERCIELGGGKELFCADRLNYRGHSDVVIPLLDRESGNWFIYTCRESDHGAAPRVALYDSKGERVWGDVDQGHMDMGWVARLAPHGRQIATAIRIEHKTCGPDGRFHLGMEEMAWEALDGKPVKLPFSTYQTIPVDLDGDGMHELVRGIPGGSGEVLDGAGSVLGSVGGTVAMARKFMDLPGEQLLAYYPDGKVRVWADAEAEDNGLALSRYAHPLYAVNDGLVLGGL